MSVRLRIPGAKSAMGAAEQIISMMPRHNVYLEGFGGTGAVFFKKRPAWLNVIIEKDGDTAAQLRVTMKASEMSRAADARFVVRHADAFDYLSLPPERSHLSNPHCVAYFDPPYVMATRRSKRAIYRHEFTDADHRRLAGILNDSSIRACILISGYAGSIYGVLFKGWRRHDFTVMTRGGPAVESVWCNFDPPKVLHDARFVGKNFTDRQRIQRKAQRWASKLMAMPPSERCAVLEEIQKQLSAPPSMGPYPCHESARENWCDRDGPGGFMGHTCIAPLSIRE
jgi:DNA adenine methylase